MAENRFEKADKIVKDRKISRIYKDTASYKVESESKPGETYDVNITYKCRCEDFKYNSKICKHILASLKLLSKGE